MYGHYLFTPRELTNWCLSLLRYNLNDLKDNNSVEPLLEIWAYEAYRLFQDRLVDNEARQQFDTIISNVLQDDWRTTIKLKGLTFSFFLNYKISNEFIKYDRSNVYYMV
jgi:hypothetical protein